jgi:hypothetical protein
MGLSRHRNPVGWKLKPCSNSSGLLLLKLAILTQYVNSFTLDYFPRLAKATDFFGRYQLEILAGISIILAEVCFSSFKIMLG